MKLERMNTTKEVQASTSLRRRSWCESGGVSGIAQTPAPARYVHGELPTVAKRYPSRKLRSLALQLSFTATTTRDPPAGYLIPASILDTSA